MEQIILWFNMMAFTLMFGSFGATYVVYAKYKVPWLRPYLLYLSIYAFFLLLSTYHFFSQIYLPHPLPVLDSIVVYLRLTVSLLLFFVIPRFILSIVPQKAAGWQVGLHMVLTVVIFSMVIVGLARNNLLLSSIANILFNGYLGLLTLYGLLRVRSVRVRISLGVVVPFLYFSAVFYAVLVILALVILSIPPSTAVARISIFTGGLFCFLWGSITLGYLVQRVFRQDAPGKVPLPGEFLEQFSITDRESEIISLLLHGRNNREIGEKLFISPRTVEAHIYNIYRKCSVKNKLELANLISDAP